MTLDRRNLMLLAAFGSFALLAGAFIFQSLGYAPCNMCIWQRWPHGVAIALAVIAFALAPRRAAAYALYLGALALIAGAGIGVFHAGVELGYWEGPTTCSGGDVSALTPAELIAKLQAAPLVRCDEVAWSFIGISMAGWNAILSVGLALTAFAASRSYASSSASQ